MMLMNDAWGYANERLPVASWSCLFSDSHPSPIRLLCPSLPPRSGPPSCLGMLGGMCSCMDLHDVWWGSHPTAVPHSYRVLWLTWKTSSCSHKLKIASAMQISIQQAFVEVYFFQAPQLFPTCLQKPAVAYPKGRRAFNSIMCGKRQQLYAVSFQHG